MQSLQNTLNPIAAIILAVLALSIGDALIKAQSLNFPLWQLFVLRSVIAVTPLIIYLKIRKQCLLPQAKALAALRSIMLTLQWIAYYAALPTIGLTIAGAAFYTIPLFITLFSALFSDTKITPRGWFAITLGFIGVLIMLRPNAQNFSPTALLPLIAAILYALSMVLTNLKLKNENPIILGLNLHFSLLLTGLLATLVFTTISPNSLIQTDNTFIFGNWTTMNNTKWFTITVLALATTIGAVFSAYAYQKGHAPTIACFDYSYLVFLTLWGFLIFSEQPDGYTLTGMITIVASGILAITQKQKHD